MRESIGASFVVYAIVIFVAIFSLFFIGGLSYTKAFKIKNRIIDILEENECYGTAGCNSVSQINSALKSAGYRVGDPDCDSISKIKDKNILTTSTNGYQYCVYQVSDSTTGEYYYGAVAFMYFEIPVINAHLKFPVYGETKVMGKF